MKTAATRSTSVCHRFLVIPGIGLVAVIFFFVLSASAQAGSEDGFAAYRRGDYATALREFLPLAEQGDAEAQYVLGVLSYRGRGVPEDHLEAVKWFSKAAQQGYPKAQYQIGFMHLRGEGVRQDPPEAEKWFIMAADNGDFLAMFSLAEMYEQGRGIPKDFVRAYKWYSLAATAAPSDFQDGIVSARDLMAENMSPGETAEANRLVREWNPKAQ